MKSLPSLRFGSKFLPGLTLGCLACLSEGAAAQTLSVTNNLQLWLKADAGITADANEAVLSWNDQSSSADAAAHVATAESETTAPKRIANALNGKPVLRFDGVDDFLAIPDSESLSITGDLTTYFVIKFDDFATFRAVWAKTNDNFPGPTDFYTQPGSGIPQIYRGGGTGTGLAPFASTVPLLANTWLTTGFGMEGTTAQHFLGSQISSSGNLAVEEFDSDTPLLIGTRADRFTKMKGDIAEILIYDRALTAEERTAVAGYLGEKYGIANLLPTTNLTVTPAGPHAAGTTVTLAANPADPDGSLATVRFFANGNLLGTATAAPWDLKVRLDTPGSYTFTTQVTDNRNAVTNSTPVVQTVTAGAAPVLAVTTDLQLWLKADSGVTADPGGTVLSWNDQSGKTNHAQAIDEFTAPAVAAASINGLPTVRFDGVDDQLQVADSDSVSITGDLTSFFVVRMDDFETFRSVWAKTAGAAGNLPAPTDFYTLPGSGLPRVFRGDGDGGNLASLDAARPLRAAVPELAGFVSSGTTLRHYLNGTLNGTGNGPASIADSDTPLWIGTRQDLFTRMKGDIAEILIYNRALPDAELESVQQYLATRYALPLTAVVNAAPVVTLTAPLAGGTGVAPVDVPMSATATDADGSIVKLEFLINGGVAATDTTAPYSATVNIPVASTAIITARATDNLGTVRVSEGVTFTATATEPIPLPATAQLKLWLRADKGVTLTENAVSAWADQSGNFNNAQQTEAGRRPVVVANALNGKPALRFDGGDDSLVAPASTSLAITGDMSTFVVVKFDDYVSYNAVWARTQNNQPAPTDFYTQPNSGILRVFRGNGAVGQLVDGLLPANAAEYTIMGFDQSGTTLRHYLNGDWNGQGEITATIADTGRPLYIGTRDDQFTRMKGEIAEIILYDSALSGTDRTAVFSYLSERYGIALVANPPPSLSIVRGANGTVTVSWPGEVVGWQLESSADLQGPWELVPDVFGNEINLPADGRDFFRLSR